MTKLTKAKQLAKARLSRISAKTGIPYELNEAKLASMKPETAIKKLNSIRLPKNNNKKKSRFSYELVMEDNVPGGNSIKKLIKADEKEKAKKAHKAEVLERREKRKAETHERNRIKREEAKEAKRLPNAIDRALKRIQTIEEHTGLKIVLDVDYYKSIDKEEAIRKLNEIRYSNLNKKHTILEHAKILSEGINPSSGREYSFEVPNEEGEDLLRSIRRREIITGQKMPTRLLSPAALGSQKEYYDKYKTKKEWEAHLDARDSIAMNNYTNNIRRISILAGDDATKAAAEFILHMLNTGELSADRVLHSENLHTIATIELFDSLDDATLRQNGQHIIEVLVEEIPVNKDDLYNWIIGKGYSEDVAEELTSVLY